MQSETIYLIIPGYGNSDEGHWQTYFESQLTNSYRVQQKSWEKPYVEDWIQGIQAAVSQYDAETVVLISHSMGGIAIAHWAGRFHTQVKGAFIVAPPDLEHPYQDLSLESFTPIPRQTLPFPSVVIGSSNDPWATVERTRTFSDHWGSQLLIIGDADHISTASGYGKWEEGLRILRTFVKERSV